MYIKLFRDREYVLHCFSSLVEHDTICMESVRKAAMNDLGKEFKQQQRNTDLYYLVPNPEETFTGVVGGEPFKDVFCCCCCSALHLAFTHTFFHSSLSTTHHDQLYYCYYHCYRDTKEVKKLVKG